MSEREIFVKGAQQVAGLNAFGHLQVYFVKEKSLSSHSS